MHNLDLALWKFSETVGSARYGAVTHPVEQSEKKKLFRYLILSILVCDLMVSPSLHMLIQSLCSLQNLRI